MRFEWDLEKSEANRLKHGISLEDAVELWRPGHSVVVLPSRFSNEPRMLAIGKIAGKHWTVIITERRGVVRLISARRSRKNECEIYDQKDHCGES